MGVSMNAGLFFRVCLCLLAIFMGTATESLAQVQDDSIDVVHKTVASTSIVNPAGVKNEFFHVSIYAFDSNGAPVRDLALVDRSGSNPVPNARNIQRMAGTHYFHVVLGRDAGARMYEIGPIWGAGGDDIEVILAETRNGPPMVEVNGMRQIPPPALSQTSKMEEEKAEEHSCAPGKLRGRVLDAETNAPISDVVVLVRGAQAETHSDVDGVWGLDVSAGTWGLSFIHPSFNAYVQEDIAVSCASETVMDVHLSSRKTMLDTLVVKIPHIEGSLASVIDERKKSNTITEVLGSEQMSRNGDGDAAAALRRVTGLTVVGGKYVYVRGLGERYSSTLMNGASLPSPEPERRVVPLDLFPSGVLKGMVIRKAYSPELPGEFGGGTVELRTRGIPESFTFKLSAKTNARLGTTFAPGLGYPGGPFDLLGMDAGHRALPEEIRKASGDEALLPEDRFKTRGYSPSTLETFGEEMANVWSPTETWMLPGLSLASELGDRFEWNDWTLGYLAALSYGNASQTLAYQRNYMLVGSGGALEKSHSYNFTQTEMNVDAGGVLALEAKWKDLHSLRATTFLGRITDDSTRTYQGYNRDVDTQIRVNRLRFVERTLLAEQLHGTHQVPAWSNAKLDWRYTYALAMRTEPDRRETRYDQERGENQWLISNRPEGNQRLFSNLVDHSHDVGVDFTVPFLQWDGEEANLRVGSAVATKSRLVDTRRYKFQHKGALTGDPKVISRPAEEIFRPEYIGSDGFQFEEFTQPTDNYDAAQLIAGSYAMVELPLTQAWSLQGGARLEYGKQNVRTYELFNPNQTPVEAEIETLDVLPAANLTWALRDDMKVRGSTSITVSRPDFRELSPATFNDVTGGRQLFGNPELERATIYSADLRWEWYPGLGNQISAAAFYKHFAKPIEQVVIASAQQSVTFQNAKSADNVGLELESRWELGDVVPAVEGTFVAGNLSLIHSQVTLPDFGITTSKERPLQGQSPYVLNVQAGYDAESMGLRITTLYNVFGPRILEVGAQGAPDVYEQPFHSLDLVVQQKLPAGMMLRFSAKNLLDLPRTETQGDEVLTQIAAGRAFSLGLSWAL